MDNYSVPASQAIADAYYANPTAGEDGPTSYAGAFGSALPDGASPPAAAAAAAGAPPPPRRHGKLMNDPIHGCFRLDPACTPILDTRQFQRLRRLKQLGTTYYVFPGACHNRFEHSLGVAHLARRFAHQLWSAQRAELGDTVERADLRVVELAGLCHDLGHGPFSHVFEREFLGRLGVAGWEHEAMSAKMLDYIVDDNHLDADAAPPEDLRRVKDLITAGGHGGGGGAAAGAPTAGGGRALAPWLAEIVANGRNSIDVDKFDYLARDAHYCGVRTACDFGRIMQFSRVIGGEICYKHTEYMNLHELFHARAYMCARC
jgi:HD superfamily phosphohydrolase